MKNQFTRSILGIFCCLAFFVTTTWADEPIAGVGPTGEIQKLHTDFQFTEGPASDGKGNLYFTDIPAQRIYKLDPEGKLTVANKESRHSNGLMFDSAGRLIACEMDGQLVAHDLKSGERTVLAAKHNGARFNAPNDLVIDTSGGVYFTDPRFRAPTPFPQGKEAFYYRAPEGQVTRLGDDLPAPNGILLSPDEKTLYVVCSLQSDIMAYPIESPGKIGEGRVFATFQQPEGKEHTGGDGLTVDTNGNLYITSRLGVQVFDPAGKPLGLITLPEQPANVAFGGPENKTLYATARTSLYAIPMQIQGHVFPGRVTKE